MNGPQTSAALYNLVLQAMRDMGLLGQRDDKPVFGEAHIPHAKKGALLALAAAQGGANSILSIGQRILGYRSVLAIAVLGRQTDPLETLRRWQRLEKIYHSRHRTVMLEQGCNRIVLQHRASQGPAPGRLDDLLIAGVVVALLENQGCADLVAEFVGGEVFSRHGRRCAPAHLADCSNDDWSTWSFRWRAIETAAPRAQPAPQQNVEYSALLESVFLDDPADSWTVQRFGERCGLSARTLQRRLAEEGASVQGLLRTFRANAAASLLAKLELGLIDVTFACGYADQPHFNREFKRCIGMTPKAYRELIENPVSGGEH